MTRYIDADALMKTLIHHSYHVTDYWNSKGMGMFLFGIEQAINEQPTVDAVPVIHGKWITEECLPGVAVCSICGHEIRGIGCQYTKYCDECGARMDAERKED